MAYPEFEPPPVNRDVLLNLSAMKVALDFAHDGAIRARCYTDERQLAELQEVGRQMDKARLLHTQIMRALNGGKAPLQMVKS